MKFREFNLPGYNQHRCFSELGWDKHDGRRQGHELTPKACPPWLHGHSAAPPSLSLRKGRDPGAAGAFLHTEEHSQRGVFLKLPHLKERQGEFLQEKEGSGPGNSWQVQWLELHAFTSKGEGSFLSWGKKTVQGNSFAQVTGSPQPENLSSSLNSSLINTDLGRGHQPPFPSLGMAQPDDI